MLSLKVLQDYTGEASYVFNPAGWMFDEAGGNWDAIEKIFGKEARANRCVSCKFHFYQCAKRQQGVDWSDKAKQCYINLVRKIVEAPTPFKYEQARKELIEFSEEKKGKRGHISSWFKWWHKRRTHIFDAFKSSAPLVPTVNLAEVGHSKWAKKGSYRLTLAMAAEEDVAEAIMLSKKLAAFRYGSYSGGRHRSQTVRQQTSHSQQVARAKAFGDEVANESMDGTLYENAEKSRASPVDKNCSHRATKRKRKTNIVTIESELQSSSSEDDTSTVSPQSGDTYRKVRFRPTPSKAFLRSLELAKKGTFTLLDSNDMGKNKRTFSVRSDSNTYNVCISDTPTCDCPYATNANVCKHVIFVLMKYFNVKSDDYKLHQKALTSQEVEGIFCQLELSSQFPSTTTSDTNQPIFTSQNSLNDAQRWVVTKCPKKPGPKPSCPNCKSQFTQGDVCVSVDGLYIPPNKDKNGKSFSVKRTFRFCLKKNCISCKPPYSNLNVPPSKLNIDDNESFNPKEFQTYIELNTLLSR